MCLHSRGAAGLISAVLMALRIQGGVYHGADRLTFIVFIGVMCLSLLLFFPTLNWMWARLWLLLSLWMYSFAKLSSVTARLSDYWWYLFWFPCWSLLTFIALVCVDSISPFSGWYSVLPITEQVTWHNPFLGQWTRLWWIQTKWNPAVEKMLQIPRLHISYYSQCF